VIFFCHICVKIALPVSVAYLLIAPLQISTFVFRICVFHSIVLTLLSVLAFSVSLLGVRDETGREGNQWKVTMHSEKNPWITSWKVVRVRHQVVRVRDQDGKFEQYMARSMSIPINAMANVVTL